MKNREKTRRTCCCTAVLSIEYIELASVERFCDGFCGEMEYDAKSFAA